MEHGHRTRDTTNKKQSNKTPYFSDDQLIIEETIT